MNIPMEIIHQAVCTYFNIKLEYPFQNNRIREIAEKRQIIHFLAKKLTSLSLSQIGTYNPLRVYDHATIMHSISTTQDKIDTERKMRADIIAIENLIKATFITSSSGFIKERSVIIESIKNTRTASELHYFLNAYLTTKKNRTAGNAQSL